MEILHLGSHRVEVRLPEKGLCKGKNSAILLNDGELIKRLDLRTERAVLVGVYPNDRLSEYTPWPESAIRPGAPDFGGQLSRYHRELADEILPALIEKHALDPERLAYGGYSLGGLAAVMSLWEMEAFAGVLSLWGVLVSESCGLYRGTPSPEQLRQGLSSERHPRGRESQQPSE